ncbi:MAG TPA: hypothetical protein VGO76_20985 [Luteibacter sp.]|jgi:hypothetical protein|nr:hypothetical protein [Luteibacter sp.]
MNVEQRSSSTFHLAGMLQFAAIVMLLNWGIATHSHALNVAIRAMYVAWLVVGSAVIVRRRSKRRNNRDRLP